MKKIVVDAFKIGDYPQLQKYGGESASAQLIQDVASTYDLSLHEAPVILGHASDYPIKSAIPAFGWVGGAFAEDGHLKLSVDKLSPQFQEWFDQGLYKKVSAAFYAPDDSNNPTPNKWHLHHLAFLGGQPPQVKGLEGIQFKEFDRKLVVIEFADAPDLEQVANDDTVAEIETEFKQCLGKIKEYLADDQDESTTQSKIGLALSDCYYAMQGIVGVHFAFLEKGESIKEKIGEVTVNLKEKLSRLFKITNQVSLNEKESDMDEKTLKEFQERQTKLETELNALKAEKQKEATEFAEREKVRLETEGKVKDDALKSQIAEFIESQGSKGRSVNKLREMKVDEIMFALAKADKTVELAEGKKANLTEIFEKVIEMIPAVSFGESMSFKPETVKTASRFGTKDTKGKVDVAGVMKVQFAEKYLADHRNEDRFKNKTEKQALADILVEMTNGRIEFVEA